MKSGKKKGGLTSSHKSYRIKLGIWRNTNRYEETQTAFQRSA